MSGHEKSVRVEPTQEEINFLASMLLTRFPLFPEFDFEQPVTFMRPISDNFTPEQIDSGKHAPSIGKVNDAGVDHLEKVFGAKIELRGVRGLVLPERGSLSDRKLTRYSVLYPGNGLTAHITGFNGTVEVPRADRQLLVDVYDDRSRPAEVWTGLSHRDHQRATATEIANTYTDISLSRLVSRQRPPVPPAFRLGLRQKLSDLVLGPPTAQPLDRQR